MSTRDIFQSIRDLEPEALQRIVDRLEYRGRDPAFVKMREAYLDQMGLTPNARVLETGCGTGVVSRALARRTGFAGLVVGIDFSDVLIQAGRRLAHEEKLTDRIEFRVGDSHALDDPDGSYDFVIAHTLVSHVVDPKAQSRSLTGTTHRWRMERVIRSSTQRWLRRYSLPLPPILTLCARSPRFCVIAA
jgi:2-polyprenyl-3-methyl-5-hydroxy-6-metoxy-1,4-benzoquinol methylase